MLILLLITAFCFVWAIYGAMRAPNSKPAETVVFSNQGRDNSTEKKNGHRNLSLQPEAFNMARRLGQRFSSTKREKSHLVGTVTIGSDRRTVQTLRTQTDEGEEVEIHVAGIPGSLTWDAASGSRSSGVRATGEERDLLERLVLDSPDQFVLAQLRGAGYRVVMRNVRPTDAGEAYKGPLWDIVRVDDPEPDADRKPQSGWRLYYVNTKTGFIDRIVSKLRGETIEAEVSDWTTLNGELVAGQITWHKQGQSIMQYRLTTFSHQ